MMPVMTVPLGAIVGAAAAAPLGLSLPGGVAWLAPLGFGTVLWLVLLAARSMGRTAADGPCSGARGERRTQQRLAA